MPTPTRAHEHAVQFYDSDDFLAESVRDYLLPALQAGDAGIVVATDVHRDAIEAMLVGAGVNLSEAAMTSRYIARHPRDLLAGIMVGGRPDPVSFERVIGYLLTTAAGRGRSVRIFGEAVAILWSEGNIAGALELEGLWNGVAVKHPFSVLCAYSKQGLNLAPGTAADLDQVYRLHSKVIGNGGFRG